ncbi:FecR family protein [Sphingomonas oryzagri]
MIRQLLDRLRDYLRARRAAILVVRLDEKATRNYDAVEKEHEVRETAGEQDLRGWIGDDQDRANAYNSAYRAFHGASAAARQIYERRALQTPRRRRLFAGGRRIKLIFVTGVSLLIAFAGVRFVLEELDVLARHDERAGELYATRVGEVRPVRLDDGSRLIVDTDSIIRVAFSPNARMVTLVRGRARFDVAYDAARPFIVSADDARIIGRNSVFDVEAYRLVSVRLLSGALDVRLPRAKDSFRASSVSLRPGQQLRFDPAMKSPPAAPQPTPPSDLQWVSGMKTFDDVPVSEIIEEVNRYSMTKIRLADPAMGSRRVFLDLDIRDSSEVAQNLALYLRLDVDASKANALILRPQQVADEKE